MGMNYVFAASGAVCAGIILYAIYRKMKGDPSDGLEVFETKILQSDDLRSWVQQNSSAQSLSVYLLYGNKGHLAGDVGQQGAEILKYMERNTKVFSRFDDFIVQLLFNDETNAVEKYRIITFEDVAKDLNDIFEGYHFYSSGIIKLV